MFDLALPELLVIVVIAILVVPTKDLPTLMRSIGKGIGKARRTFRDFQRELDKATRVDELEDIKRKVSDIKRRADAEFSKDLAVGPARRPLAPATPKSDPNQTAAQGHAAPAVAAPSQAVGTGAEDEPQSAEPPRRTEQMKDDPVALPAADTKT
jgi:sec-independent protein translocase protein TatB